MQGSDPPGNAVSSRCRTGVRSCSHPVTQRRPGIGEGEYVEHWITAEGQPLWRRRGPPARPPGEARRDRGGLATHLRVATWLHESGKPRSTMGGTPTSRGISTLSEPPRGVRPGKSGPRTATETATPTTYCNRQRSPAESEGGKAQLRPDFDTWRPFSELPTGPATL